MTRNITITAEEGMLIDWLLTMHSFDPALLERLCLPENTALRKKAASAILSDSDTSLSLTEGDLEYLLVACPITFRFYKNDIGFSLKKKLLAIIVPPKLTLSLLEKLKEEPTYAGNYTPPPLWTSNDNDPCANTDTNEAQDSA